MTGMKWSWAWPPFLSTYVCVFIMELLDNTQLIQVYYSSKYGKQWVLALASWTAFACTGLIGSAFSALRALSEYVTRSIELFFALVLFTLGVITLSHSEIILSGWGKFTNALKHKIADPFLYKMGERPPADSQEIPDSAEESATTESHHPLRSTDDSLQDIELTDSKPAGDHAPETIVVADANAKPSTTTTVELQARNIAWWRLFILVFATVFILELPDKTMLMVATLAQSSDYPVAIFVGYALAMITQSLIALVVGKGIGTAAEKYGPIIEIVVGIILLLTGAAKIAIMIFIGDFTIDFFGKTHVSSSSSYIFSSSTLP